MLGLREVEKRLFTFFQMNGCGIRLRCNGSSFESHDLRIERKLSKKMTETFFDKVLRHLCNKMSLLDFRQKLIFFRKSLRSQMLNLLLHTTASSPVRIPTINHLCPFISTCARNDESEEKRGRKMVRPIIFLCR